ncbi:MAG: tetratricopeptide repeat protein [Pirellulales bacterium]|nr:tetratricopeptide repeat protein [Pirellulales bacterium]
MRRFWVGRWIGAAAAVLLMAALGAAQDIQGLQGLQRVQTVPQKKTGLAAWSDSVASGFKRMADAVKPKTPTTRAPDPISLSSTVRPSPDLYLAVAQSYEEAGALEQAEAQYRKAVEASTDNLPAMIAYGRFLQRRERLAEAESLYQKAARAHPQDTVVLNCLGLCHAQHDQLSQAVATFEKAIQIDPAKSVLRNNLAAILVDLGRNEEAFSHLRAVHNEATTYYNLGYLLQKRGDKAAAAGHFAMALRANPQMNDARVWLEHLRANPDPPSAEMLAARQQNQRTTREPAEPEQAKSEPAQKTSSGLRWPGQGPELTHSESVRPPTFDPPVPSRRDPSRQIAVPAPPPGPPSLDLNMPPMPELKPPTVPPPAPPTGRETVHLMPPAPLGRSLSPVEDPSTATRRLPPAPPIHTDARPAVGLEPQAPVPPPLSPTRWYPESPQPRSNQNGQGNVQPVGPPPLPDYTRPPSTPSFGTTNTQVVYPLPPVLDTPPAGR